MSPCLLSVSADGFRMGGGVVNAGVEWEEDEDEDDGGDEMDEVERGIAADGGEGGGRAGAARLEFVRL